MPDPCAWRNACRRVIGGESQARSATLDDVLRLDTTRRAWTTAPPMPTARNYARAVVFQDAIWTVGGNPAAAASHSAAGSNIVERFGRASSGPKR